MGETAHAGDVVELHEATGTLRRYREPMRVMSTARCPVCDGLLTGYEFEPVIAEWPIPHKAESEGPIATSRRLSVLPCDHEVTQIVFNLDGWLTGATI